jgi:hypothetical protein
MEKAFQNREDEEVLTCQSVPKINLPKVEEIKEEQTGK